MREFYKEAIGAIRDAGKDQLSHQDFERIVDLFNRLMDAGYFVECPATIADYVTTIFGDETAARDLQLIYETLEVVHRGGTTFAEETIREIMAYH